MPQHTLSMDLIEDMVKNYRDHQLKSIENSTTSPMVFDAHSVWFSLEALKDYIKTIEEEVAKHPKNPISNLGLRFYYSAYPDKEKWNDELSNVPEEYEKLHTVIAIPTTEINGENYDFDPYDNKTYDGTKPTGTGLGIMAENHNALIPPGASMGEWF